MREWHKNWFSNMVPFDDPLEYEGIKYYAPENFYQAMKVLDQDTRKHIASLEPRKAKTTIRKYIIRSDWDDVKKLKIMEIALNHKFRLDTAQGKRLLEDDEEIIEWNSWNDLWWGKDIETSKGKNNLGQLLMKIRNELKMMKFMYKK